MFVFAGFVTVVTNAQDTPKKNRYPYWTISKDVQRIQFKNSVYVPATISTGGNVPASKGVQQLRASHSPKRTGIVSTNGYPSWTISKGAARFQAQKNSTE